jgi:hypothetical protein
MNWRDPNYRYNNAEQSRKPGYLAKRFAAIRKAQAEANKLPANVNVLPKKKKEAK